ncbi:hypothetical protein ACFL6N_04970 [Thermodesulfobacteriota bacterium]
MKKSFITSIIFLQLLFSLAASGDMFTELAMKTYSLNSGMSLTETFEILGYPNWAVLPADTGEFTLKGEQTSLELYWNNPGCSPVIVKFDRNLQVTDWNEGTDYCGSDAASFNPPDDYSCSKPDRVKFCR